METKKPVSPLPGLKATIWPVSHGRHHNNTSYESSAFFVENDETERSFLIFGDVEADSVSGESTNRQIWEETALRIRNNQLNTIFLECSYSVGAFIVMMFVQTIRLNLCYLLSHPGNEKSFMDICHRLISWKSY
jgi:hypothetical protein